jgi:hypothetical protein
LMDYALRYMYGHVSYQDIYNRFRIFRLVVLFPTKSTNQ